jgi:8-oxo-dGTP diphosphatase
MSSSSSTPQQQQVVRVGVGVLVKDPLKQKAVASIFCGIRKNAHGSGELALPGGHLEFFETWSDCAIREVQEEMNMILNPSSLKFAHVTNDIMSSNHKHYVTIFMMGEIIDDTSTATNLVPTNMEPHKCEGWKSYTWKELCDIHQNSSSSSSSSSSSPTIKLFGPLAKLIEEAPSAVLEFMGAE